MYENYPLWHAFFSKHGFRVVISHASSKEIYASGMDTIPSDEAFNHAQLVH